MCTVLQFDNLSCRARTHARLACKKSGFRVGSPSDFGRGPSVMILVCAPKPAHIFEDHTKSAENKSVPFTRSWRRQRREGHHTKDLWQRIRTYTYYQFQSMSHAYKLQYCHIGAPHRAVWRIYNKYARTFSAKTTIRSQLVFECDRDNDVLMDLQKHSLNIIFITPKWW